MASYKFVSRKPLSDRAFTLWTFRTLFLTFLMLSAFAFWLWRDLNNQAQDFSSLDNVSKFETLDVSVFTYDFLLSIRVLESQAERLHSGLISKSDFQSVLAQTKSCFTNFASTTPIYDTLTHYESFAPALSQAQALIRVAQVYDGSHRRLVDLTKHVDATADLWIVLRSDAYGTEGQLRHDSNATLRGFADRSRGFNAQLLRVSVVSIVLLGGAILLFYALFKEMTRARKSIDQVISTLSHDLRSPLHVIGNAAPALLEQSDAVSQRKNLVAIQIAVQKMDRLIDDIFIVSRGQKLNLNLRTENLKAWFDAISNFHAVHARNKGLVFETRFSGEVEWVEIDAHRLAQAIGNLLENAIKYTDSGSVNVDLNAILDTPSHCELKFVVTDTGVGIASSDHDDIFLPYTRAASAKDKRGLGLGLSIFKDIADSFGATYAIESTVGLGTTFRASFPVKVSRTPGEQTTTQASIVQRSAEGPFDVSGLDGGVSILVVDDEQPILDLTQRTLVDVGYGVDTALSGSDALSLARNTPYQLVITDINMPGMDGFAFARQVVDVLGFRPYLIAISADENVARDPRSKVFDLVLRKPISLKTLIDAIASYEEGRSVS